MNYLPQILEHCKVAHAAAADLSQEDFVMLRKQGLGASDVSIYLGTMSAFNKSVDDLITDKLTLKYTEKDKEIGNKPSVRMGHDLEDIVLQKATVSLGRDVVKVKEMFRFKEYPYLTMNLDGVMEYAPNLFIPVEAKVVTTYGDKYYDWNRASRAIPIDAVFTGNPNNQTDRQKYIDNLAAVVGIPAYYYVQVQHELLGMGAHYGYLAALRIKEWQVSIFTIAANKAVQSWIITEGNLVWQRIEKLRKMSHG